MNMDDADVGRNGSTFIYLFGRPGLLFWEGVCDRSEILDKVKRVVLFVEHFP